MAKECFVTIINDTVKNPVALTDDILYKGTLAAAGSKILENFIAPFTATVAERLEQAGYGIAGKASVDEFGIGAISGDLPETISGAVACVKNGNCEFALGNDFSGKLRREASENGLYYIHPTYGTVSRFGLIASVSSMDQIGVVCKTVGAGLGLLSKIAGHDEKDGTSLPQKTYCYTPQAGEIRLGIPANSLKSVDNKHQNAVRAFAEKFGAEEFDLAYFDVFAQVHYILSCAEISNNINRFDGVKFGYRAKDFSGINDLYLKTRTEGFGLSTKLAAIMGSMVLSTAHYAPLYDKSMRIRRLIHEEMARVFEKYDVIALPNAAGENNDPYRQSALYALAGLAGLPCVSVPYGGAGVQLYAKPGNENALFAACERGCAL